MKNIVVLLTVMLTWFCFGFAIAFGANPTANDIQFAGFYHGWFGDMSGGLVVNETAIFDAASVTPRITMDATVPPQIAELAIAYQ
jgi:ammonia channel protein AmtB